jgi:hypothetical protein
VKAGEMVVSASLTRTRQTLSISGTERSREGSEEAKGGTASCDDAHRTREGSRAGVVASRTGSTVTVTACTTSLVGQGA